MWNPTPASAGSKAPIEMQHNPGDHIAPIPPTLQELLVGPNLRDNLRSTALDVKLNHGVAIPEILCTSSQM